jgi:hypothetical protein
MATYLSRATLEDRLTLAGLTALGSTTGVLTAGDEERITEILEDISGRIDSKIGGLGIDVTAPPRALVDIALDFAKCELWRRTWVPKGLAERDDLVKASADAEKRLAEFQEGFRSSGAGVTPGVALASSFSWTNVADAPSSSNPRRTLRSKMDRNLP